MQISNQNALLFWIGRTADIANDTSVRFTLPILVTQSENDFLLTRFFASWVSTAADPSVFSRIEFKLQWPQQDYETSYEVIDLAMTTNPGIDDLTAVGTAIRPRQYFFKSPAINYLCIAQTPVNFIIENYAGAGKPNFIDLLFEGKKITEKVY